MTTWIDVFDTAVKIGLGALISTVATFITLVQRHKQERETENASRRLDVLERVAKNFDAFVIAFENYVISVPLVGELNEENRGIYEQRVQRQLRLTSNDIVASKESAKESHEAAPELLHAMTLLRLLVATDAVDATTQYRTTAERFWLETSEKLDNGVDVNAFVTLRKELSAAKHSVYRELGELYPAE